jgi:hypothetical protein
VTERLQSLEEYVGNQSVTGFFIEHAVLQTISTHGLKEIGIVNSPPPIITFEGFPDFKDTEDPILYVPSSYFYPAIDGVILQLDHSKREAYMFPIQVTIAKSHKDSEKGFFNKWNRWSKGLESYHINVTFLWITTASPSVTAIEEDHRSLRSGKVLKNCSYSSRNIPLEAVNKTIWNRYKTALEEKERQDRNELPTLEN